MDVSDANLVQALLARYGPQPYRRHRLAGRCRYEDLYPNGDCPWCRAIEKREARTE